MVLHWKYSLTPSKYVKHSKPNMGLNRAPHLAYWACVVNSPAPVPRMCWTEMLTTIMCVGCLCSVCLSKASQPAAFAAGCPLDFGAHGYDFRTNTLTQSQYINIASSFMPRHKSAVGSFCVFLCVFAWYVYSNVLCVCVFLREHHAIRGSKYMQTVWRGFSHAIVSSCITVLFCVHQQQQNAACLQFPQPPDPTSHSVCFVCESVLVNCYWMARRLLTEGRLSVGYLYFCSTENRAQNVYVVCTFARTSGGARMSGVI